MLIALCEPTWNQPLADELRARFSPRVEQLLPGAWQVQGAAARAQLPWLAWARQTLPNAAQLTAPSIQRWAELIGQQLIAGLAEHNGPWRWLASGLVPEANAISPRRVLLIDQALREFLKRKQKRLLRTMLPDQHAPWQADEAMVQVGWTSDANAWWSCLLPSEVLHWRRCLSRTPTGIYSWAEDKSAPARAFAKLVEAELQLGRTIQPGDRCVDLGASPGSWTWWAIEQGASVVAVDRSPLRDDLMQHERVEFVRGDAFAWQPEQPVDWLLCDVAAFPERIEELLTHWLTARWCNAFVVTIKFRGSEDYALLPRFESLLRQSGYEFLLRHMTANKNEVTALGYWPTVAIR